VSSFPHNKLDFIVKFSYVCVKRVKMEELRRRLRELDILLSQIEASRTEVLQERQKVIEQLTEVGGVIYSSDYDGDYIEPPFFF
jgi:hypothetical protein